MLDNRLLKVIISSIHVLYTCTSLALASLCLLPEEMWFFTVLFFNESSSLHATQNNFPCLTSRHSPGNSFTRLDGETVLGSLREGILDFLFLSAPVVFGFSIFLLRAKSDFVGGFSLSMIEVLEHSGRSHDGGVTVTGSTSLSTKSSPSAMPF